MIQSTATFVDRIRRAANSESVFRVVNEFIIALYQDKRMEALPMALRPGRISSAVEMAYYIDLLEHEVLRQGTFNSPIPDAMLALRSVLANAGRKLRSTWHH
jgi:hypothetical protein